MIAVLQLDRARKALARGRHPTPALFVDPLRIGTNIRLLREALPDFDLHYAVKCNPGVGVLNAVHDAGAGFEVASEAELKTLERLELLGERVIFSAPVKREHAIAAAAEHGVEWYTATSVSEIIKIARHAPNRSVLVRIAVSDEDARWKLSGTWGAAPQKAVELLETATALGARDVGLMFHVGSQNRSPSTWGTALDVVRDIMASYRRAIACLDIGGGFPVSYGSERYGDLWPEIGSVVADGLSRLPYTPELLLAEPGRAVVAEAGVMLTTVLEITEHEGRRWVHIDAGAFNALYEASPQGGGLPLEFLAFDRDITVLEPATISGITCDADDIVARSAMLPVDLEVGELLAVPGAGAYSTAYASNFCGVGPAKGFNIVMHREDSPPVDYDVVLHTDDQFETACQLEFDCFEQAGFLEEDGSLSSVRKIDHLSRMIVVPSITNPLGVGRLLDASPLGFVTLNDMALFPQSWSFLRNIDLTQMVECLTMAPINRDPAAAIHLYRAMLHDILERDRGFLLTSIDESLLSSMTDRYASEEFGWTRLGPPIDYVGSPTVPVVANIYKALRLIDLMGQFDRGATAMPLAVRA